MVVRNRTAAEIDEWRFERFSGTDDVFLVVLLSWQFVAFWWVKICESV